MYSVSTTVEVSKETPSERVVKEWGPVPMGEGG
jgi:hypothetical protein